MKENKYDDEKFFEQYKKMDRSVKGLEGAGEWYILKTMIPELKDKRVLDLGCGFGWHCRYAAQQGAKSVTGIDLSEKMLEQARADTPYPNVEYLCQAIEDINFPENSFDVVISSLAFHYVQSFEEVVKKVKRCLVKGGDFVFSAEHPVFTAYGTQDWYYDEQGNRSHWPVDNYYMEGVRKANFLGEEVTKYHKTVTTYVNTLLEEGFRLTRLIEPQPDPALLDTVEGMRDELRRPIFLIVSAKKEN